MKTTSTMRVLVLEAPGSLVLRERIIPEPEPGEVLIRVKACGVCGSDLPRIFGGEAYFYPLVPGHELAGEVVSVHSPQDQRWLGKRVTVYPLIPCYQCAQCESARYELCDQYGYLGSRRDGGFAEYVTVPAANCVELPDSLDFETGALSEPAAVTWHALKRSMGGSGDQAVIFGLGPIGMLCGCWARLIGCSRVAGVDIDSEKFPLAKTLGFDELIHPGDGHLVDRLSELMGERGASLVVEASGTGAALQGALQVIARRGNLLMLGNQTHAVPMQPEDFSRILRKEIRIHGTWNSSFNRLESDWEDILTFQKTGRVSLDQLITRKAGLQEAVNVLSAMNDRLFSFAKVILVP